MSRLEILAIDTTADDGPEIFKFRLDQPRTGHTAEIYSFSLSGWVLGKSEAVESIAITCQGDLLKTVPVNLPRPEVGQRHPGRPGNAMVGFHTEIGVVGLPETCELAVSATIGTRTRIHLAAIRVRRGPLESPYSPVLQPLMITSLGRSGSTWAMRLFGEHPEIVINREHPHEIMAASYWMHLARLLTEPANHAQSTEPLGFAGSAWTIGHNPYFTRPAIKHPALRSWFGYDLVARMAGFCQQNIDEYYLRLAAAQGDPPPHFFAEKNRANHIPRMFFDLYPGAREIFLVRDFRDMACSMLSFNRKRGYIGVGPEDAADDADFIRKLRPGIQRLLDACDERRDRTILLRYEDLVLDPDGVLPGVLAYLGVQEGDTAIRKMQAGAAQTPGTARTPDRRGPLARFAARRSRGPARSAQVRSHQTSGDDPARSVGRWKTDLPPALQAVAHEALGDLLERAGYGAEG